MTQPMDPERQEPPSTPASRSPLRKLDRIRDAVVRSSQIGKLKLDATLLRRERDRLIQQLGEAALNLIMTSRLAVPEEIAPLVKQIQTLEGRIEADSRQMASILKEGLEGG